MEIGEAIHTVRAVDEAGKIVNEVQVTVMSGGKYVYNPGGQNCYDAKTQTYGTPFSTVPTPDEEQGFPEWLDVTRFDYVLEDFPKQVQGFVVGGATRTGLFHAPFERCQRLWMDNGNSFALTVEELKGRMLCRLPPGGHCRVAIKPGQHSFRAVDAAGNVVSQVEESTKAAGKYIYNPGRKSSYRLTSRTYSVAPGTFPGCASGSNENKGNPEWTDATEADYVFEPFPASVPASLFAGACATKKGLFRQ